MESIVNRECNQVNEKSVNLVQLSALFRAFSFGNCIQKQIVLINIRRLCKTFIFVKK